MEAENSNRVEVSVESGFIIIKKNGKTFRFELRKISERLAKASDEELKQYKVSPSGYGIHWYSIDEDISIPALLNEPMNPYGEQN